MNWAGNDFIADIIKSSQDYAFVVFDRGGRIRFGNKGAEIILKFAEGEMEGLDICSLFTPEDVAKNVPHGELRRAVQSHRAEDERWHIRKDGTRFWAAGVMSTIKDPAGEIIGFAKMFRDKTRRKLTEDEIKISTAGMVQFSHTAAHDLQAPLRNLTMSLQMSLHHSNPDQCDDLKSAISSSIDHAKHMSALIKNLLAFSEVGEKTQVLQPANCNAVLDMAISYLGPLIEEHHAVITRDALPDILAVPTEIEQIFQNLITNAIKYRSERPPTLHINAQLNSPGWTRFTAEDNGIGIESKYAKKIFESFERLHTNEDRPGTGLGLAICKKIVEKHGGQIWVESIVGLGSKFHFTLPTIPTQ